jgi:hypothetical protein
MEYILNANNPKSKSGRELTPFPKQDYSTNRKCTNSLKKWWSWMYENAKEEVKNDSWQTTLISAINLNNLSTSDKDTLNLILFDTDCATITYN